jgi:hypothetical protein
MNFARLMAPEILLYRSDLVFASELTESWMKTPVWRMNSLESWGSRSRSIQEKSTPPNMYCWSNLKTRRTLNLVIFQSYCFAMWFWQLLTWRWSWQRLDVLGSWDGAQALPPLSYRRSKLSVLEFSKAYRLRWNYQNSRKFTRCYFLST